MPEDARTFPYCPECGTRLRLCEYGHYNDVFAITDDGKADYDDPLVDAIEELAGRYVQCTECNYQCACTVEDAQVKLFKAGPQVRVRFVNSA